MPSHPVNDFEDFMRQERQNRASADDRVQEWQAAVKPGDYFVRDAGAGVPIYGEILKGGRRPKHLKHYRFTKCYSVYCPDGEMGDVHVSTLQKIISGDEFTAARKRGWQS